MLREKILLNPVRNKQHGNIIKTINLPDTLPHCRIQRDSECRPGKAVLLHRLTHPEVPVADCHSLFTGIVDIYDGRDPADNTEPEEKSVLERRQRVWVGKKCKRPYL